MELTIAIPTFRRPDLLRKCLDTLRLQSADQARFEVLIIDNAGQPEVAALTAEYGYRYIHESKTGHSHARNRGIKEAAAQWLFYLDDDVLVPPETVERLLTLLPDVKGAKKMTPELLKQKEGETVLQKLQPTDRLILLDERGFQKTSVELSAYLADQFNHSRGRLVFLIGGAYGFSPAVYERAHARWALSKLTFSHQMIRLFALEQLYRALSIQRGEPYHNEG